jgi:hypothetical protein
MDEAERSMGLILTKNQERFSGMARSGHRNHGRGAVFIWQSEGEDDGGLTKYRASYIPADDPAFERCGPHPKEMAHQYDPEAEFIAVFVEPDGGIQTAKVDLAAEPPMQ